jgi:DNA modification methylase
MANPWPADAVERWPVDKLIPYARNARKHSDAQVAEIAGSIREWGWTIPALIGEDGRIIAGHGRVLAAHKLGITDVPVMIARGWSEAQKQAYTLADNQIALHGTWDLDLLKVELADLRDQAVDLATLGFNLDEVRAYLGSADEIADEVPPTPEPGNVKTKLGEVYRLGRHRLICGDATDTASVAKLMQDQRAAMCFTSPPYAQQRVYGRKIEDWSGLMRGVCANLPLADDAQLLINLGMVYDGGEWLPYWDDWIAWMRGEKWRRFAMYVWDQGWGLPGDWNGRLAPSFELVFHFNRIARRARKTKVKKSNGQASRPRNILREGDAKHPITSPHTILQPTKIADAVIRVRRQLGRVINGEVAFDHPAIFPVALAEEILTAFSEEGDIVYEPFAGSGTQIIAAERVNRACYAIEINPAYCDVIVERWRRVTGQEAKRDGTKAKANRAA